MTNLTHETVEKAYNCAYLISPFVDSFYESDFVRNWVLVQLKCFDQQYSEDSAIKGICEHLEIEHNNEVKKIISELLDDVGIFFDYKTCEDLKTAFNDHCDAMEQEESKQNESMFYSMLWHY
tara:strand:- start:7105 stop:7470 length:366 start_codon:yes stop_codon:yes gene_type:complete